MTIKTPEQIAYEMTDPKRDGSALLRDFPDSRKPDVRAAIVAAIEADRAQRDPNEDGTIHGAAIMALQERAENADDSEGYGDSGRAERAAEWIENNPDDFWCEFAGPMLDEIETEYGA